VDVTLFTLLGTLAVPVTVNVIVLVIVRALESVIVAVAVRCPVPVAIEPATGIGFVYVNELKVSGLLFCARWVEVPA